MHLRIFRAVLVASLPSLAVGIYVFDGVLDFTAAELPQALALLVPVFLLACVQQALTIGHLVHRALAAPPGEAAGARLRRLLLLPRQVEVLSNLVTWLANGLLYGLLVHHFLARPASVVWLAPLLALLVAAFPGILLVVFVEDEVLPLALAEHARDVRTAPPAGGFFWTRQRRSLPYAFSVALVSLLGLLAFFIQARRERVLLGLSQGALAIPPAARAFLEAEVGSAALGAAGVALVFLAAFAATGFALARRQARAAAAVQASLATVVAGAPEPPRWVATDEIGDLAAATARISDEMRSVFDQLRAMASGDLGGALEGDSGLLEAFRVSRAGMLELTARMGALARGEAVAAGEVSGDLGAAFAVLQDALAAVADQARTIAAGDLRRDVALPGALGAALRRMTEHLRAMVGRTQEVAGDVGALVSTLQAAAAQLSAATAQQVAAVTETASTMTEMARTSAVSADRAGELIRQGETASVVADEGSATAESAVAAMNALDGALGRVAQASQALDGRVRRIDAIVDTVAFIADQSSTLAINAALEAARAGESGKGFAVVAREIRTLAADSRRAAGQIRQLLGELRDGAAQMNDAVGSGRHTAGEGGDLVRRLGEVVAQLGVTVHDAMGLMRQVEGSARQHQAGVSLVSQALTSLQAASESIRDGATLLTALSADAHALSDGLTASAGRYTLPAR